MSWICSLYSVLFCALSWRKTDRRWTCSSNRQIEMNIDHLKYIHSVTAVYLWRNWYSIWLLNAAWEERSLNHLWIRKRAHYGYNSLQCPEEKVVTVLYVCARLRDDHLKKNWIRHQRVPEPLLSFISTYCRPWHRHNMSAIRIWYFKTDKFCIVKTIKQKHEKIQLTNHDIAGVFFLHSRIL